MNTAFYIPEMCESLAASKGTVRREITPIQRANGCLPQELVTLQTRTEEMQSSAPALVHELRNPLSVIITTSNAIFNITDLTSEEFYEYLQQIRSNAYKMDEIINNLLPRSERRNVDAPQGT